MDSKERIREYYRQHGTHWEDLYQRNLKPSVFRRMEYALNVARSLGAKRIIDVGCGRGQFVRVMRDNGFVCDGIDLSAEMLNSAPSAESTEKGSCVQGDLTRVSDYPASSYDLVTAFGVFVHEIDEDGALAAIRDKLTSEGQVIVSFRNALFSLFTLNKHTVSFFGDLLKDVGLTEREQAMAKAHFARLCTNSVSGLRANDTAFEEVFRKFHNPLNIGELFSRHGFDVQDLLYLNFHPAPPAILDKIENSGVKALSTEERLGRSWEGLFLASSFLVRARKCNRGAAA